MKIIIILFGITALAFIFYLITKKTTVKKKQPKYKSLSSGTLFKVIKIVDGDTFKISPGWKWNNKKGKIIRPTGYDTPERKEPGYQETTEKLKQLLLNNEVELKNPIKLSYNRLLCNVYFNGKNLAEYFPEYKA